MIKLVKVTAITPLAGYELRITFSDGAIGTFDFAPLIHDGGRMVEPLKEPAFFKRVFIENGVLAWPNGFDIDAIALSQDMKRVGAFATAA